MHNTIVRAIEQWHATSLKISCSLHALLKNIHISESLKNYILTIAIKFQANVTYLIDADTIA